MPNPWEEQIAAWLERDREELAQWGETSIDLDRLLTLPGPIPEERYLELYSASEVVEKAIDVFSGLIEHLERLGMPFQPGLRFSLGDSTSLLAPGPPGNWADLAEQLDRISPPVLELEDWSYCRYIRWPPPEQYECPLPFRLIHGSRVEGTVASYVVFRIQEQEPPPHDDVYVRRVRARYFPERYRKWSA